MVSGTGWTNGTGNGLGNPVVGDNGTGNLNGDIRAGSHDIALGWESSDRSDRGPVAGVGNTIGIAFVSVNGASWSRPQAAPARQGARAHSASKCE